MWQEILSPIWQTVYKLVLIAPSFETSSSAHVIILNSFGNYGTKWNIFHMASVGSCLPERNRNVQGHLFWKVTVHCNYQELLIIEYVLLYYNKQSYYLYVILNYTWFFLYFYMLTFKELSLTKYMNRLCFITLILMQIKFLLLLHCYALDHSIRFRQSRLKNTQYSNVMLHMTFNLQSVWGAVCQLIVWHF